MPESESITGQFRTHTYMFYIKWLDIYGDDMEGDEVMELENDDIVIDVTGVTAVEIELLLYFIAYGGDCLRLTGGGTKRKRRIFSSVRDTLSRWHGAAKRLRQAFYNTATRVKKRIQDVEGRWSSFRGTIIDSLKKEKNQVDEHIRKANAWFRVLGITDATPIMNTLGVTTTALGGMLAFAEATPARVFPSLSPAMEMALVPYEGPKSPIVPYEAPARPQHTIVQITDEMSSGASMLNFKNALTRKLKTKCRYVMSIQMATSVTKSGETITQYGHYTSNGVGPHLYGTYNTALGSNSNMETRNLDWNTPKGWDCGMETMTSLNTNKGVGWNNIVYVFAADYPFLAMNHDAKTQDMVLARKQAGHYLSWKYVDFQVTTDRNLPVQLTTVVSNKDWQYLTHYYTVYEFDFFNSSFAPYIVEILYFKFKADPDAMNYQRQVEAVKNRQTSQMEEYIYNIDAVPQDINIVHRKRIMIPGVNVGLYLKSTNTSVAYPNPGSNHAQYKYVLKHKYVIKRPILSDYNLDLDEFAFFNTYYSPENGIYCRIQAFKLGCDFSQNNVDFANIVYTDEDTINQPTDNTWPDNNKGKGVHCIMYKTSHFKLDENMYKSYTPAA